MDKNMGTIDRVIRAGVGIALVLGAMTAGAPLVKAILGLGAIIMLATALVGTCPLYQFFGLNTGRRARR